MQPRRALAPIDHAGHVRIVDLQGHGLFALQHNIGEPVRQRHARHLRGECIALKSQKRAAPLPPMAAIHGDDGSAGSSAPAHRAIGTDEHLLHTCLSSPFRWLYSQVWRGDVHGQECFAMRSHSRPIEKHGPVALLEINAALAGA